MSEIDLGFIHRFVPAPGGYAAPTLLLLHGTGGDENDLLKLGQIIAPSAALLSPRGNSLDEGAPRFFRRLSEGVFDIPDLIHRSNELADFVSAAANRYGFDPNRVVAAGFSNGANIAAATMLLRPETLAGAILLRAMVPLVLDEPPELQGKRVLMRAGRKDPIVETAESERLAQMLRDAGADVTLQWSPVGHGLDHDDIAAAQAWMKNFLPQMSTDEHR